MDEPVYLNHAGTSWPKPPQVLAATANFWALEPSCWADQFRQDFETVASFFGVPRQQLLLTPSCTAALALAIQELSWQAGDRALVSSFEHHALLRNLQKLADTGVETTALRQGESELVDLEHLRAELVKGKVRLVALTAACNVTGLFLGSSIHEVISLAHKHGAKVLIDGAQLAGWVPLDLMDLGVDLFTFAGHKAPRAPWGIGGLFMAPDIPMQCPSATCTLEDQQAGHRENQLADTRATSLPGYCDAGSVNLASLAGLAESCRILEAEFQSGQDQRNSMTSARLRTAQAVAANCRQRLEASQKLRVLHGGMATLPTVAFDLRGHSLSAIGDTLARQNVTASIGFQCAPSAHEQLGTQEHGVVRFSFAPETPASHLSRAIDAVHMALGNVESG